MCSLAKVFIFHCILQSGKGQRKRTVTSLRDDEFVMLRSQNGYLKHKLAKMQPHVSNPNDKSVPTIYVITPTYARPQQKAELTRLCHTFLLGLFWF